MEEEIRNEEAHEEPAPQTADESAAESTETETPAPMEEAQPINQEAVEKRISAITFQKYEERRKREEAEAKLRQYEEQRARAKEADIPPAPDPFDDDYQQKIAQREELIRRRAMAEAEKEFAKRQQQREAEDQMRQKQAAIKANVERVQKKAMEYGIKDDELDEADKRVSMFIRDPSLANYILSHDKAPLIIKHLSGSIEELEKISGMDPVTAAGYIASEIAPKAANLKPKLSKAPDPVDIPEGKGAVKKTSKLLEGYSFE